MPIDDKRAQDIAARAVSADEAGVTQALRQHAEALSHGQSDRVSDRLASLTPEATRKLLHELQVHQIELEMQNDELRRAEHELDASRARYFALYDLAPVGYCSVSEQGLILQANLAAATLMGATRSTLVKQALSRFLFKADQDLWYQHRKLLIETGQAQSLELRLAPPDSAPLWVQMAASATQDGSGPLMILVVLTDVSDRKLMEAAMRETEARFRALVEWSAEAMLVHASGKLIYANPAAVKLLCARSAADLLGKPFLDLFHPASQPDAQASLKQAADPAGAAVARMHCLKLDGGVVTVEFRSIATAYDGKQVTLTSLHEVAY